jgi:lipocalin
MKKVVQLQKAKVSLIYLICIFLLLQKNFISTKKLSLKTQSISSCKNFKFPNSDFKLDQFVGTWYPLMKTESLPIFSTCESINFSLPSNSSAITGEIKNRKTGKTDFKLDLAKSQNSNSFTFSYIVNNVLSVIDTDYKSWAIVYTCTNMIFYKMYNAVILSRTDSLPQETLNKLKTIIKDKLGENLNKNVAQGADKCPVSS